MTDQLSPSQMAVSRRSALRRIAYAGGGTAALAAATVCKPSLAADAKAAKDTVGYQDSPQGAAACGNCSLFQPPAACQVVAGNISPGGWCKIYAKKAS